MEPKEWTDSIDNLGAQVAHHNLRKHDVPHNLFPIENQKQGVEFNVSPMFFFWMFGKKYCVNLLAALPELAKSVPLNCADSKPGKQLEHNFSIPVLERLPFNRTFAGSSFSLRAEQWCEPHSLSLKYTDHSGSSRLYDFKTT